MPTLYRPSARASWRITMYFGDHFPPHFHIVTKAGGEALLEIATLEILEGKVPKAILDAAREWARQNRALLDAKWEELHRL